MSRVFVTVLVIALGAPFGMADEPDAPLPPMETVKKLPRHSGAYVEPTFAWSVDSRLTDVRRIWPDPAIAERIYVLADGRLWRSDDAAATWKKLNAVDPQRTGALHDIAFFPGRPAQLYLATSKGVWRTDDAGATAKLVADADHGLNSDHMVQVCLHPGDPTGKTLLAMHGRDVPGVATSYDGGTTWQYKQNDHYVYRLIGGHPGARGIYLVTAPLHSPDVLALAYASSIDAFPQKQMPDLLAPDVAIRVNDSDIYVATFDQGVWRIGAGGKSLNQLGREDVEWASADVAWGPTADDEALYLLEPRKLGLVRTTNDLQSVTTHKRGLYTGSFVQEGAVARANANGTIIYAAVNGSVYVGRNVNPLRVETVTLKPAVMRIDQSVFSSARWQKFDDDLDDLTEASSIAPLAGDLISQLQRFDRAIADSSVQITARVAVPQDKPKQVTVDLSRLHASPRTPMFDDGQHGDGQADDGVYGATAQLSRLALDPFRDEWRSTWPGKMGLTVSAVGADGRLAGAVGSLTIHIEPTRFTFIDEGGLNVPDGEGTVVSEYIRDDKFAQHGRRYIRINAGPGQWSQTFGASRSHYNIAGFYAMTFWVQALGEPGKELNVQLRDAPTYSYPTTTEPVPVVSEGFVDGSRFVAGEWRQVIVPVDRLLRDSDEFRRDLVTWVVLSGDESAARAYRVDNFRFIMRPDEAAEEDAE